MSGKAGPGVSNRAIYSAALDLTELASRQAYLDNVCGDDAERRLQVEQLLAAHSFEQTNPLDKVIQQLGPEDTPASEPSREQRLYWSSPPVIDRYKVLEPIGEGGMGVVYVAEQTSPVRRKVALKIIKPGMDSKEVVARFEAERQALAMMDHPNIARVLDAATMDDGRPYFIMELVMGVPITEFCDDNKLTNRERLELFIDVCSAVQHAHQKGIIHRDLKPSNIMVTMNDDHAIPKVIDFGISKALSQPLTERLNYTAYGQMVGTPLYMSPEQAQFNAVDVDTRSDVYSLGVLLYELLTGSTPFDKDTLQNSGFDEMHSLIREVDPLRPSHRVSTMKAEASSTAAGHRNVDSRKLSQSLSGELDWIVMKALEKKRDRRYDSASRFAADVQRYLNDKPVEACPPTLLYRAGKLVRRNKVAFGFGSVIVTSLLIGVIGLSFANKILSDSEQTTQNALQEASQNFELAQARAAEALESQLAAETARQQAEAERQLAEQHYTQSFDLIQQLVENITKWNLSEQPSMEQHRVQLLEAANVALDKLLDSRPTDAKALHLNVQVLFALAIDYTSMERLTDALHAYQIAAATADDLLEESVTIGPDMRSLTWRIRYSYSLLLHQSGRPEDAIGELRIAVPLIENELHNAPDNKDLQGQLSNVLAALGGFEEQAGDVSHAKTHLRRAIELLGIRVGDDLQLSGPISQSYIENLLREGSLSLQEGNSLIALASRQNKPELQLALWRQAISVTRNNAQQNPLKSVRHQLAFELGSFADYLHRVGNLEEALQSEQQAVVILERLTSEFPTFAVYGSDLLRMQMAVERTLVALNRHDEALTLLNQLIHQHHLKNSRRLEKLHVLYASRLASGVDSLAALSKAIERFPGQSSYYRNRGVVYGDRDELDSALMDLNKAIELISDEGDIGTYQTRGMLFVRMKQFEKATADYDQYVERSSNSAQAHFDRGEFYLNVVRNYEKAIIDFDFAIENNPNAWHWNKHRGLAHFHLGRYEQALADIAKALELNPKDLSCLTWIDPVLVTNCPDEAFREGMRALVDRGVALNDCSMASLAARAQLLSAFGAWEQVREDLDAVVAAEDAAHCPLYQASLVSVAGHDMQRYKKLCQKMLSAFEDSDVPSETYLTAWTCTLAPEALDNYAPAIKLARHAVEKEPDNQQYHSGLGAILMRSGQHDEAKSELARAIPVDGSEASQSNVHHFLALTEHHLSNSEPARLQLQAGDKMADEELSGAPSWNRRLTIELLRNEAQTVIGEIKK